MENKRPKADRSREEQANQVFDIAMSPEEYAARFAHTIFCSSFGDYEYSDPHLDDWIQRFHHIVLRHPELIDSYRRKYLTEEEISVIEEDIRDQLENGL